MSDENITKATYVVHWPGHDTYACDMHSAELFGLANIMGFKLYSSPYIGDHVCENCKNKLKKEVSQT